MRHKHIVALLLLVGTIRGMYAQEIDHAVEDPAVGFPRSIGIGMATSSTVMPSISYQEWLHPWGYSIELGFFYAGLPEQDSLFSGYGRFLEYRAAVGGQYRLFGDRIFDWIAGGVHVAASVGHTGYRSINHNYSDDWEPTSTSVGPYEATIDLFAGPGTEIILFRHFSLMVDVGFQGTFLLTPPSVGPVGIGVQIAARFRF